MSTLARLNGEVVRSLTADEARALTNEVKIDAATLWAKLLALYEGEAHLALGYSSWADYCAAEFDMGRSRAYQLLDAARVVEAVSESTIVERPASEAVARELAPLLREGAERVEEVWGEVVARYPEPTAKQVREAVSTRRPPEAPAPRSNGAPTPLLVSTLEAALRCLMDATRYASNLAAADIPPEVRRNFWAARGLLDRLDVALRQLFAEDDIS
jgi:hypothetical protein